MKVFIGGSKSIRQLTPYMLSIIDRLCENGHSILVGDCFGVDRLVQERLAHKGYDKVTVFASGSTVRNNAGGFPVCMVDAGETSGFEFYRKKDREMAERADIAVMFWDGKSKGTWHNIIDMQRLGKFTLIVEKRR